MVGMTDLFKVASGLTQDTNPFRLRFGTVVSVDAGYSCTITLAGAATNITSVKYIASARPKVGQMVIVATDGVDIFIVGVLAEANTVPTFGRATASASLNTTGSDVAITGCSVTLSLRTGDVVVIHGHYDATCTTIGTFIGTLYIDGVAEASQAITTAQAINYRLQPAQTWTYTATADASVTFVLRARNGAAGAYTVNQTHTTITAFTIR